ncbi:ADP-L-glycero-D-manno-heptose-6-epimerase [Planctomycetales bacterium 10988]|nr:ADP-L-glycero-D-manno-heptose-6-epimerase [Planctomycetales bacterium 10988]
MVHPIVVTGGAGFIGSAFVWHLNQLGRHDVIVVDRAEMQEETKNLAHLSYAEYLTETEFLDKIQRDCLDFTPEAIVHLGACSSTLEMDKAYLYRNNYRYTKALAQWSLPRGVRFLYASSAATYGDGSQGYNDDHQTAPGLMPLNPYGQSKQMFDEWALRTGVMDQMVGLKFFNVFGPNEYHKGNMVSMVVQSVRQIQATGKVRLFKSYHPDYTDGGQMRDFVYVKDCLEVMAWLLEHPEVNGLLNVGTGQARSWNDLATAVFSAMDRPVEIEYIEMPERMRSQYQYFTEANMTKLTEAGYPKAFRSLEDAVRDYVCEHLLQENPYLTTEPRPPIAKIA